MFGLRVSLYEAPVVCSSRTTAIFLFSKTRALAALSLTAFIVAGCASHNATSASYAGGAVLPPSVRAANTPMNTRIKHVIIVIQENRSFDNIFAGYPGADAPTYGYEHDGTTVPLRPSTFNATDYGHDYATSIIQENNGKMNGFDLNVPNMPAHPPKYNYTYLQRSLVAPYWSMARQYVLADHMFPTEVGPSFTAHLDLIAATTQLTATTALVDAPDGQPWGCDAPAGTFTYVLNLPGDQISKGPFPCFTQFQTEADSLDAAGVTWKYYAPAVNGGDYGGLIWSAFDAISDVRNGPDWTNNVISPQTTVLTDIAGGKLPSVSWVVPDWEDSDHPGSRSTTGPSWVSSIVNSVGQSPYWSSTAIVVLWDDWGGWYDNVPPPQLDSIGLGIRVPCLIISPYAKEHYVSHTQYEFGSVLKFVEQTFGLPSLGATDVRANSLVDSLDFARSPRAFKPIVAPFSATHFLRSRPTGKAPDND